MKNWLKDVVADLLSVLLAVLLILTDNQILLYIFWGYTILLLIGRVLYFFIGNLKTKADKASAPKWFYHLIYILVIVLTLMGSYYYLSGLWFLIWLLSLLSQRKK